MDLGILRDLNSLYGMAPSAWDAFDSPLAKSVLAIAVVVWLGTRNRWLWILVAVAAIGVTDPLSSRVIKPIVARDRPCATYEWVQVPEDDGVAHCGSGFAMPSTHAANTAALAVVLDSTPLYVVAGAVGISRVATGQHWPSDVVAGWILGAVVGASVRAIALRFVSWP